MKFSTFPLTLTAFSVLLSSPATAHHGQEFFLLYDARVQAPTHGILQGNFSFTDEGTEDFVSLAPSLSVGILPRTAFNLRADFAETADEGWAYRSIEPGFQFDITPPGTRFPVRIGLALSYQFGQADADHAPGRMESAGHGGTPGHHKEITGDHEGAHLHERPASPAGDPPAHHGHGHKAETHPESAHQSNKASGHAHSTGIHNHDDDLFAARFIIEADLTPDTLVVGNVISVLPEDGSAAWGYAIGVRHRLRPGVAIGVEALGDFDSSGHQEILGSVFWEPIPHLLYKVGLGTGLSANSPDASLRAGVAWTF